MAVRLAQPHSNLEEAAKAFCASWDTIFFLSSKKTIVKCFLRNFEILFFMLCPLLAVFSLEFALKALGMGFWKYFASGWNVYDFCVTLAAIVGVFLLYMCPSLTIVVILRPLRYQYSNFFILTRGLGLKRRCNHA